MQHLLGFFFSFCVYMLSMSITHRNTHTYIYTHIHACTHSVKKKKKRKKPWKREEGAEPAEQLQRACRSSAAGAQHSVSSVEPEDRQEGEEEGGSKECKAVLEDGGQVGLQQCSGRAELSRRSTWQLTISCGSLRLWRIQFPPLTSADTSCAHGHSQTYNIHN